MSSYAWIITKDCDPDTNAKEGTNANARGVYGPRDAHAGKFVKVRQAFERPGTSIEGVDEFRMDDDDGNVMYYGFFGGDPTSEDAFGPLDDFGTPNAGCTAIFYKNPKTKAWEQL